MLEPAAMQNCTNLLPTFPSQDDGNENTSHSMMSSGTFHCPIHAVEGYSNCKVSCGWNSETCSLKGRPGCGLGRYGKETDK